MGNEFCDLGYHSAEYLAESRNYWWNDDFVELIARRWALGDAHSVLDVGCGVGHWSKVIGRWLCAGTFLAGIDRDMGWPRLAALALRRALPELSSCFLAADLTALPFRDDCFDLVTCQTVLIHVGDVVGALTEMARVARPGGRVAVAEPNNRAATMLFDSVDDESPIAEVLAYARFEITCERGRDVLGEGDISIGDRLPELLRRAGMVDIAVHLSDRAVPILAPYPSPSQRAAVDELRDTDLRDRWIWDRATSRRYFLAGGGENEAFEVSWELVRSRRRRILDELAAGTYSSAGAAVMYLVAGTKAGTR
jgi:SAM-dependent methyltransferase